MSRCCDFCGEGDHKTQQVTVLLDKRRYARWRLCRACAAGLLVFVIDPRKHRHGRQPQ